MADIRRRRLASSVWIPLRQSETIESVGERGQIGFREEIFAVGSVALFRQHRQLGEELGWHDIGLIHTPGPFAFDDERYKPAEAYLHDEQEQVGVELVLEQTLNRDHQREYQANQDLVLALDLLREGDSWVRPNEGYVEVIRARRDGERRVVAIEIKSAFLRDYLCARGLVLRIAQYRQRCAVFADASHLEWADSPKEELGDHDRFTAHVFEVDEHGGPFGGSVAMMKISRTDVDENEDVPLMGPDTDDNTTFESRKYERGGKKLYRAEGELWREEWIEPSIISERIRGDRSSDQFSYFIDASGTQAPAPDLDDQDVGRWLWFKPQVIEALLHFRGSSLEWYTQDTGEVRCSPSYGTHFGVNRGGLINVYAYDIAKLPRWQQRIWHGYNVVPDGPVSSELLDSQARAEPAETHAPEAAFALGLHTINQAFDRLHGGPLFREHETKRAILRRIHRFRAIEGGGLLALAKDVARLTADSIDIALLRKVTSPPPEGKTWGSLKLMEHYLAGIVGAATAHGIMSALVGVYDMRLGDAHLPSGKLKEAYALLPVDDSSLPLHQGLQLLTGAARSLRATYITLKQKIEDQDRGRKPTG
jgi:hypothetical protein